MLKSLFADIRKSFRTPSTPESLVKAAHAHLEAGRLAEATPLLEEALQISPQDASAINLLGFSFSQTHRLSEARALIEQAISINPTGRGYHSNLAETLQKLGDSVAAEKEFRRGIELTPEYGAGYLSFARFLAMHGRQPEALRICQQAVRAVPDLDEAHIQIVLNTIIERKDYASAIKTLTSILERNPKHSRARLLHGQVFVSLNDFSAAEHTLRSLVRDEPDNVEALIALGHLMLLVVAGEDAEACFRLALGIEPTNAEAARYLVSLLLETLRLEQAEDILAVFVRDYPDDLGFCRLSGRLALQQGSLEEAVTHFEHALQMSPRDIDSIEQIANIRIRTGRVDEAIALFRQALALNPLRQMTRYNYAFALLTSGNFKHGLSHYESRLRIAYEDGTPYDLRSAVYSQQEAMKAIQAWDGSKKSLQGKRIVVWREQGLGDALMMMRFLPELKRLGAAKIGIVVHEQLEAITSSMGIADEIVPAGTWQSDGCENYDLHCSMMSLPHLLNASIGGLGKHVPYLQVPEARVQHWRETLAQAKDNSGSAKLLVGLVWAGNPGLSADKVRSIALTRLVPLQEIPGIQWISLQKGKAQGQLEEAGWPMLDFMDSCNDFTETAAQVMALDLVISVDTAMVHLSGALGKSVWMLNRASSEWRWMRDREDSPWYPSLRLFNQQPVETWEPVVQRVATALGELSKLR